MLQITMKVFTILCCVHLTTAANILALTPLASPSHHIWNSPLLIALAQRGHNVTALTPLGQKSPVANLTELVLTGIIESQEEDYDYEEMPDTPAYVMTEIFFEMLTKECVEILKYEAWTQLMNYPPETKFDLIIIESIGTECLLPGLSRFGDPPIVSVNAFNTPPWMFEWSATPKALSHVPHCMHEVSDRMTFSERLVNFLLSFHMSYVYHYHYLPEMDKVAKEYFGPRTPSFQEMTKKISMSMPSFHPALDHPYARTPTLIPVAGIQIKHPQPLPQDLKEFLDSATEGAIFFSLGSNMKSENLKPDKKKAIMDALAELPQKVLWKFEADSLPGKPKNVKIVKWAPQSDILAHPNVKVFISHAGLLSTHEAIHRGVPVLGIPFFAEQPINIQKLVHFGAGIRLDYKDVTKESLLKALKALLHNTSYRENMKALSERFRDDPQTPLERAVFWTEYVIRHKGAYHLQSAAKELNFVQFFLLDVIAFLLAIPALLVAALYWICCRRNPKQKTKQKEH